MYFSQYRHKNTSQTPQLSFLPWRQITTNLMPATLAQETCARNLCKLSCTRNLHLCRSILCTFFLVQVSCTQLSTALFQDRNCPARDSCCCARNCDELASNFSCKFLVQVSCTIFWYKFLQHVSLALVTCPPSGPKITFTITIQYIVYSHHHSK